MYKSFRVDDAGGVVNGKLDPGESADIRLLLRNAGAPVGPTTGLLVSRSPWLEVLDGSGAFAAAGENETTASTADWFRVRALAEAPVEIPAWCDLVLTGSGYDDTLRIPIVVGDSMNLPAGPDGYGYRIYDYTDSCYAPRPDYDWVELRRIGTKLTLGDDQTVVLPLPPTFGPWRYYGQNYARFSVCSNGFIAADSTDRCDFRDVVLPYTGAPPNIVALAWDNLDPTQGGAVWYYHDTAGHRLIVEYDSVSYFAVSGQWERAEVMVYDTTVTTPTGDNTIVLQYRDVNYPKALSVGLQNRDGTIGISHNYNDWYPRVSAPLKAQTALRFETVQLSGTEEPPLTPSGRTPNLSVGPNPCRGRAAILLGPGFGTNAAVRVFDAAGRLVRVLVPQSSIVSRQSPISLVWDGRNDSGVPVAPGLYFVQAEGGDGIVKLVLFR